MKTISNDQLKEFLKDLNKLSRKHKIIIGGCGCCGSPALMPMSKNGKYSADIDGGYPENLSWELSENSEKDGK